MRVRSVLAALAMLVLLGCDDSSEPGGTQKPVPEQQAPQVSTMRAGADEVAATTDPFGVRKINPTRPGGMVWYSRWMDGLDDRWVERVQTGARYTVDTQRGVLKMAGDTVRMLVRDPHQHRQWLGDLEVTVYARKIPDQGNPPPYSGIITDVRTNHGTVGNVWQDPCDSRGLFARLRFDGTADFGKEIRHPRTVATHSRRIWDDHMPEDEWIGYKQVVKTTGSGEVVQELWVDFPGRGEEWDLVDKVVDGGGWWGKGERPCAKGIDPSMPLRGGKSRPGSESGLPNLAVLFRVDGLGTRDGMEYRWASVREVQ